MTIADDLARDGLVEKESVAELQLDSEHPQVWDLPVRIFHWTLVAAIVSAFITNRLGVAYFKYHVWSGYAVIILVAFRIIWGIVGTRYARFSQFLKGPTATFRYALGLLGRRAPSYAGHNPLGACMVVTLLAALSVQAISGLFGNDEIFNIGPLAGYISTDLSLQLTTLHRRLFYWIAAAAAIHVLAVIAHYVFSRENLVRAMITGRKPPHCVSEGESIASSRVWLAALLIITLTAALSWIVIHAPLPIDADS